MEHGTGKWDKKMVLQLDANRVEFVTTNGHDWDSPDPYGGNDNYRADVRVHALQQQYAHCIPQGHGVWLLKRGKLRKIE